MTTRPRPIGEDAASSVVNALARYVSDLNPLSIRPLDMLLLGTVDGSVAVQPGDLNLVVEVSVDEATSTSMATRIEETYRVLGRRRVPTGIAYACAVPPSLLDRLGHETFTIVLRRDAVGYRSLYPPSQQEGIRDRSPCVGLFRPSVARSGSRRNRNDRRARDQFARAEGSARQSR